MPLDPRTPVLVGVGAVVQREDDPRVAREPLDLMAEALVRAADDAGAPALLARADAIRAPRGFWDYGDPCRQLAERFGATGARTEIAEVGILQTTTVGRAAADVLAGRADVVLIAGAEDRHRAQRAMRAGVEPTYTRRLELSPDVVLRPSTEILHAAELACGLAMPVGQYAIIENALRAADGLSLEAHAATVAELWAGLSRIAAGNPDAWTREPVDADAIRRAPMLAVPYTRRHTSQWNVDQAAALVVCSLATADALGVPADRRVFPHAVADANHMVALSERRRLHRSPGFALAGARVLRHAGVGLDAVRHLDLYSCFPSAVRVQQRELGVPPGRAVSVTGGMAFAGGPLNSYVLHALVTMARVLRADPGSLGLVTAVSGIVTKQGASLWSSAPPAAAFRHHDVTAEAVRQTEIVPVEVEATGDATVASYTVLCASGAPAQGVLVCDLADGRRTLRATRDPGLVAAMATEEFCGRRARVGAGGAVDVPG